MFARYLLPVLILLPCLVDAQDNKPIDKPLVAKTLDAFNQESARIREQMHPGGPYEYIRPADRQRVESDLEAMGRVLQAHAQESDLAPTDKVKLANAQEDANAILKHNDNNRLICERHEPMGSHVPVTSCRTYAEIERHRMLDMKELNDFTTKSLVKQKNGITIDH